MLADNVMGKSLEPMLACSHKNRVLPSDKQPEEDRVERPRTRGRPLPCPDDSTDEDEVDTIRDRFPDGRSESNGK